MEVSGPKTAAIGRFAPDRLRRNRGAEPSKAKVARRSDFTSRRSPRSWLSAPAPSLTAYAIRHGIAYAGYGFAVTSQHRLCGTPPDRIVHTLRISQTTNTTTMMVPTNPKPSISILPSKRFHCPSPVHGRFNAIRLSALESAAQNRPIPTDRGFMPAPMRTRLR